uniref:G5 domain-containing protein n=1 Tax=uncultured Streptococcus sp. TaxID=83427 RepID=UPI003211AD2D
KEVTAGVNGETVKTTTYELNPTTGEVTANEPTTATTDPVTRVVKRGTQPKVERTDIPFPTRYERDDSVPEGTEKEVTAGVNGETVKTTTYELNPTTGEVTANEPTTKTTDPVTRVVKRGTQPKSGETPETPQPKPGETPETPQPETGINVIPPTPRIVERSGGNTVEVEVPNKDADTLSITFTKRNSAEKETIVTKKDNGTWMIEKAPKGVTINPTNGLVYIPSKQIEPKTSVDTQTKHKYKQSKIVSVMPNILDLPKFEGTTEWIDVNGKVLKRPEKGVHEKEKFASYVWLESILKGDKITHIYFEGTPSVDKPEYKITVWFDEDGNPIKPEKPGTHESGNIPGYRLITTATKDGVTIHKFEKVANGTPILPESPTSHPMTPSSSPSTSTPEKPNKAQTPSPEQDASPAPSKVSEQKGEAVATATSEKTVDSVTSTKTSDKAELPNTGTEANANLAALGLLGALSGFGLLARKKKED